MSEPGYHIILNQPNVFWIAVSKPGNLPDVTRVAGLAPVSNIANITCYLSEAFGRDILPVLENSVPLTLLVTNIHTFESYQYKGVCRSVRPCLPEEEERQRACLNGFGDNLKKIGILPPEAEKISRLYFQQPSYAIDLSVKQIFIQSPQKGAGSLVVNLEEDHA